MLSSCEIFNYVRFYEERKDRIWNVNELIELFEMNLGWANEGAVLSIYEYAERHPNQEAAQKVREYRERDGFANGARCGICTRLRALLSPLPTHNP